MIIAHIKKTHTIRHLFSALDKLALCEASQPLSLAFSTYITSFYSTSLVQSLQMVKWLLRESITFASASFHFPNCWHFRKWLSWHNPAGTDCCSKFLMASNCIFRWHCDVLCRALSINLLTAHVSILLAVSWNVVKFQFVSVFVLSQ